MRKNIIISIISAIVFSTLFFTYSYQIHNQRYLMQGQINFLHATEVKKYLDDFYWNLSSTFGDKAIGKFLMQQRENKYFEISVEPSRSVFVFKAYKFRGADLDLEKKEEDIKKLKIYTNEVVKFLNNEMQSQYNDEIKIIKKNISYNCIDDILSFDEFNFNHIQKCELWWEKSKRTNELNKAKFFTYEDVVKEKKWRIGSLPAIQGFVFGLFLIMFIEILKKNFKNN